MTPAEAADHAEIIQVLQLYGQALDERAYELLDAVFTPTARLRYALGGERTERSYREWLAVVRKFLAPFAATQHHLSPPLIALDGDRARTTCRLIAVHIRAADDPECPPWTVYGVYRDELVRTPAGWRIAARDFASTHVGQLKRASGS